MKGMRPFKNFLFQNFKISKLKEISVLLYIALIGFLTSFAFHLYSQNFIFFSKDINPSLDKAYKEIHHPQTKTTQKQALNFIFQVASQSENHTQDESLKALNLLSGIVFHFGIKPEGKEALKKIYENIMVTKSETVKIRSILYLEWIALKWTLDKKVYTDSKHLSLNLKKTLNLENKDTDNLALRATEYLLALVFMNKPFLISDKEKTIILTGLNTISQQSENPEARVFAMNQLFNIAFLRTRESSF